MAKSIILNRDEAQLLVDLLEENYRSCGTSDCGAGCDLAASIRELFGMGPQPEMEVFDQQKAIKNLGKENLVTVFVDENGAVSEVDS